MRDEGDIKYIYFFNHFCHMIHLVKCLFGFNDSNGIF